MINSNPDELMDCWLSGYSNNTKLTYGRTIKSFFKESGISHVHDVSQSNIENYLSTLSQFENTTRHTKVETLKSFFNFAYEMRQTKMNLANMVSECRLIRPAKASIEFDEFFDMLDLVKKSNRKDYDIILSMYLDQLKVSQISEKYGCVRQSVNKMLKKYHPIATPEMIRNSLLNHSKKLAEKYIENK